MGHISSISFELVINKLIIALIIEYIGGMNINYKNFAKKRKPLDHNIHVH